MIHYIKRFFKNIARSSKWFKRTWGGYDWDYGYLLEMMLDKMKDMEKCMSGHGNHIHSKRNSLLIKICANHLERYMKEDDCDNLWKLFKEKYGRIIWQTKDITINGEEMVEHLGSTFSKCKTKEENEYADKVWKRIADYQFYLKNKHKEKFLYVFGKYFEYWWD